MTRYNIECYQAACIIHDTSTDDHYLVFVSVQDKLLPFRLVIAEADLNPDGAYPILIKEIFSTEFYSSGPSVTRSLVFAVLDFIAEQEEPMEKMHMLPVYFGGAMHIANLRITYNGMVRH